MRVITYVSAAALLSCAAFGQSRPSFEIADVHASPHSDNPSLRIFHRDGRYELLGATMVDLIGTAYGVKPDAVTGGPAWLEADRFEVIAKTPPGDTPEVLRTMLQSLLSDRFGLIVHNDTRLRPAYILTAGKHPRLKQSDGTGAGVCGDQPSEHSATFNGALGCHNISMDAFAETLRTYPAAPMTGYISGNDVVDQTGLSGAWDFSIKWTGRGALASVGSEGTSLFDAIDKQLGLNLEMGKALLPGLVVDSANQKPTNNLPGVTERLPELRLEFDVADIKPSTQDHPTAPKFTPGGRMEVKGVTLIALIQHAWGLDTYDNELIAGGPKWLTTERFDILATAIPPQGPASSLKDDDSLRSMLRNMLIDRFKLAVHSEEKPVTIYTLVADKPRLKPADPSSRSKCSEGAAPVTSQAAVPRRTIVCSNMTAAQFAERLHGMAPEYINRPVVDATGIAGAWDFSLLFSAPRFLHAEILPGDGQSGSQDPNGAISLFEAVERQVGLKLATEKRLMPVLVIDHVDQNPTDN